MRITFLTPADDLTGGMRVIATYARLLQAQGHAVTVVSNAPGGTSLRERLRAARRGHYRQAFGRKRHERGHIGLSGVAHRVLERPRSIEARDLPDADVLVATWWETAVWAHAMPVAKGRKVHLIQGYETWTGGEVRERVHAALRLPNRKLAVSARLAHDIETSLGSLGITVVPNAVDTLLFDAPPRDRGEPPTVGFVYSPARMKGADICARACELARRRIPALRVVAFGAEPPTPETPLPVGCEFVLRPEPSHMVALYAGADAWLFGSRLDSFGLPILEAMACRTPVVGVPVGAAPELLADDAGRLVPGECPEAMAEALVELLAGPAARWQAMSARAWKRAQRYGWSDATARFLAALDREELR